MNVLPPQAPPSAPASTLTTCTPGGGAMDAPAGFERLLADHVGGGDHAPLPGCHGDATAGDPEGSGAEPGAVAAAVHAAIAAWRADPGDVALGTHLRQVLEGTVQQATASATNGESAASPGAATAAGSLPVPSDLATPAPAADLPPVVAGAQTHPDEVVSTTVSGETVVGPVAATTPDEAPVPTDGDGQPKPVDAASRTVATATASAAPTSELDTVPADRTGVDATRVATEPAVAGGRRHRAAEPTVRAAEPAPASVETAGEVGELLTGTRTEAAGGATPGTSGPAATSASTLDRVMRAVEALEHAPPPRRLSVEVEGVLLTVAMQGDEVTVAVRSGADSLAPGWQRDLATALRGRGLDLATDAGTGNASGRGGEGGHERSDRTAREPGRAPTSTIPSTQAAEPAGLRL